MDIADNKNFSTKDKKIFADNKFKLPQIVKKTFKLGLFHAKFVTKNIKKSCE